MIHWRCLLFSLFFSFASARAQSGLTRLGEFQVSAGAATSVRQCSVDSDGQGNMVIVYEAIRSDGNGWDIYARRYNSACSPLPAPGAPLGEFRVNTTVAGQQESPSVSVNKLDGSFVVAWQANQSNSAGYDIFFRRFAADGTPLDALERLVNVDSQSGDDLTPEVAVDSSVLGQGRFVIAWDNQGARLQAQRFSASGNFIGSNLAVSTGEPDPRAPSVACDGVGHFIVAYHAPQSVSNNTFDIRLRIFSLDNGTPATDDAPVINVRDGFDHAFPQVDARADGSFVVGWCSAPAGTTAYDIKARLFTPAAIGGPIATLNEGTVGSQRYPAIHYLPDGRLIATWESVGGNGADILARTFAADLTPEGGDFVVNTSSSGQKTGSQLQNIAVDPQGNFLIGFADTATLTYRADKFYLPNQGPPQREFRVNTTTAGNQAESSVACDALGNFVIAWAGQGADGTMGVQAQRFDTNGRRLGEEFRVNSTPLSDPMSVEVAMNSSGRFVICWGGTVGNSTNIFAKAYDASGSAIKDAEAKVNAVTTGGFFFPLLRHGWRGKFRRGLVELGGE